MIEELYQEVILESSQSLRNRGDLAGCASARNEHVRNPLCGDAIDLWLDIREDIVNEVKFSGEGCAISQASASLVADLVRGKRVEELPKLISDFQALVSGSADEEIRARLGEVVALEGVRRFPARVRCAMLVFEAIRRHVNARTAAAVTQ